MTDTDSDSPSSVLNTEEATLRLLAEFEPLIRAASAKFKVRAADREDALQAGRVGVLEARAVFDRDRGVPFGAFAYRYIVGSIRRAIYGESKRRSDVAAMTATMSLDDAPADSLVHQSDQESLVLAAERKRVVRTFVWSLVGLERRAVVDAVLHERTQSDIAAAYGVSQPAVHKALKRGLSKGATVLAEFRHAA